MKKIFEDAKDKNVAGTYVYVKASDTYAYADVACTEKIDADTLMDLFLKGAVIVDTAVNYKPISAANASGVVSLVYVKAGTSNAATLTTIYSEEHSAE